MTIGYSSFFTPIQLAAAAGALYTVPTSPSATLLRGGRIRLTNTTAGAVTVTLYAVPAAGTPLAANAFASAKSIAANDFLDMDVPILPAGASLQG
jgi:hypothetical protein